MISFQTNQKKWLHVLSKLFQNLNESILLEILTVGSISKFNSGEEIFRQGDIENTFFIVLSGRFRAVAKSEDEITVLGDITEGESVGEFAFFSNDIRSASVYALRPSVTLELTEKDYLQIVAMEPEFAQKLTTLIVNRFKSNMLKDKIKDAPKNIAIINLHENTDISPWTQLIESELIDQKIEFQLHDHESLQKDDHETFFNRLESNDDIKFLVCSPLHPEWSQQCYIYADLIIIATEFGSDHKIHSIEQSLQLYARNILRKNVYLLLLHQDQAEKPYNTRKWFENRELDLHIHFRKNQFDAARFCRIITNKAVGVVLGGGGAKGFAHLGALRALREENVPIDFLGGTSAGALYGLAVASFDFDFKQMDEHIKEAISKKLTSGDLTYPIMSLMSGKKMKNYLYDFYKEIHLEDFWVNSYCITSNLSAAELSFHESGLAAQKILASIAIPGVFPPVIIDHQLHVDGGVMDNLPIKSMYQFPVGEIIALSLLAIKQKKSKLSETPSSRELILNKVLRRKKYRLPGITSIIMNSLTLNSVQKQEENKAKASLYLELNLKGFGFMDDSKWESIVQKGFEQTKEFIKKIKKENRFW